MEADAAAAAVRFLVKTVAWRLVTIVFRLEALQYLLQGEREQDVMDVEGEPSAELEEPETKQLLDPKSLLVVTEKEAFEMSELAVQRMLEEGVEGVRMAGKSRLRHSLLPRLILNVRFLPSEKSSVSWEYAVALTRILHP